MDQQQPINLFSPDLLARAGSAIAGSVSIPPCPEIVLVLLAEAGKDEVDYARITRLIINDAGMASAALKLANSAYMGLRQRVTSVQQAVMVLGLRKLLKVIYGVALKQSVSGDQKTMARFWERSSYNASVCSELAVRLGGVSPDDAHNFGLFHDVGIAVLLQQRPTYLQTLKGANAIPQRLTCIEEAEHQTSHVQVGAWLARTWHLPDKVVWATYYHHEYSLLRADAPDKDTRETCRLLAIRVVSEHLVTMFLGFQEDPEWDYAKPLVLEHLRLTEDCLAEISCSLTEFLREVRAGRS